LSWSIEVSKEELYQLAGLLQLGNLLGFDDPFAGFLSEDIAIRLEASQERLLGRGYIEQLSRTELILDTGVVAIVRAITTSNDLIVVTKSSVGSLSSCVFHLTSGFYVEQLELPRGDIKLTALKDLEVLRDRLEEFFNMVDSTPGEPIPSCTISKVDFLEALRLAQKEGGSCNEYLVESGVPRETSTALGAALKDGNLTNSIVSVQRNQNEMGCGETVTWLAVGKGILYMDEFEKDQEQYIQFRSTTLTDLQRRVVCLLESLSNNAN